MKLFNIFLLCLIPFTSNSQDDNDIFTMFYNVENLFDTINNPLSNDEEFLPMSKKAWNLEKYNQKINQLSTVFSSINNGYLPNMIGLCEVENLQVIKDLLKSPFFKNNTYTIIHKNSPDLRGIDCAFLVDDRFEILDRDFIEVKIPNAKRPTRDIVYVKLKIQNTILNIFVNHWPSRWGGQKETDHKRVYVAQLLRDYIDLNINSNESIIVMGDLNDYPDNNSINKVLCNRELINLMSLLQEDQSDYKELGSYNYKDEWNFLDHIIVSKNFFNKSRISIKEFDVFKREWLLYTNPEGVNYPSRTYGGSNWYGGFSDHLPVYCIFSIK